MPHVGALLEKKPFDQFSEKCRKLEIKKAEGIRKAIEKWCNE